MRSLGIHAVTATLFFAISMPIAVTVFMGWPPCVSFAIPYATRFIRAGPPPLLPRRDVDRRKTGKLVALIIVEDIRRAVFCQGFLQSRNAKICLSCRR